MWPGRWGPVFDRSRQNRERREGKGNAKQNKKDGKTKKKKEKKTHIKSSAGAYASRVGPIRRHRRRAIRHTFVPARPTRRARHERRMVVPRRRRTRCDGRPVALHVRRRASAVIEQLRTLIRRILAPLPAQEEENEQGDDREAYDTAHDASDDRAGVGAAASVGARPACW